MKITKLDQIENATNKRWVCNKDNKHDMDAEKGWYRYDVYFAVAARAENETEIRWNYYTATMIVKINERGLFLHDIINIKKEARTPQGS